MELPGGGKILRAWPRDPAATVRGGVCSRVEHDLCRKHLYIKREQLSKLKRSLSKTFFQFGRSLVHGFAKCLAWLEMRHALFRNGHRLATARIAAHAGWAVVHRKTAKAPDLDAVPSHQGFAHGIQNGFDGEFGIAVRQLTKAGGQFFNEVGAGHGILGHRQAAVGQVFAEKRAGAEAPAV